MKSILQILFFALFVHYSYGQGYIAPSPDATALIRQAQIGVNHYTGSPIIQIPLASVTGRELSVSASLSYNSAANRVQDIPSSTGLGWTLSAGGMITRIVRGTPDDLTNGYCTPNKSDPEPDLFIFSILGRSGRFVLNSFGSPVLYPYQDIIIKPAICRTSPQVWEIIDENGTRYQFGATSNAQETTTASPVGGKSTSYISTWHLNKIISANGTDEVSFSYTTSSMSYTNYFYTKNDYCVTNTSLKNESVNITVSTRYLSSITTSGGYIYFTWNTNREDISGGRSLANIRVNNRSGIQVQKVRLEYSYFSVSGCISFLCKRLKLDAIYDLSAAPLYTFQYNTSVNLPSRDTKNFDHWGYYNNNAVDSWIPADNWIGLSGASRTPDATKMQANLLTRINQRGGSYQQFTYEANSGVKEGTTYVVSGARIKNIVIGDGKGGTITKNYNYVKEGSTATSGLLFRLPYYSVYMFNSYNQIITMRRYSHSYPELLDVNGTQIGYSRVEEATPGSGKVVYNFTNYDTNPDLAPGGNAAIDAPPFASTSSMFWERGNLTSVYLLNEQNQTLSEELFEYTFNHPNKNQISGSKSVRLDYNNCGSGYAYASATYNIISRPFTLKKKTSSSYDQEVTSKKITSIMDYSYDPVRYQLISTSNHNTVLPTEKYITIYKYINHADYNFNRNSYCQNQLNQCLNSCSNSDCSDECYYEYDDCLLAGDSREKAITLMKTRHMSNALIEEQQWFHKGTLKYLLSANLNVYNLLAQNQNMIVLESNRSNGKISGTFTGSYIDANGYFSFPNTFQTLKTYNTYDAVVGNLLLETSRDGLQKQYAWDHNNTVIKTETLKGNSLQQATNYEYKPLVGITKITDQNNRSSINEYDNLGRLRLTKNHDLNIVQRIRYHYAGETPVFLLSASKTEANINQSITFNVSDIFVSTGGTTNISWNMGDGRTYNDNRQTVTISYPSSGTYTVSVTLSANEYAPVVKSLIIKINSPLQVDVCIDGPQYIDLCGVEPVYFGSCTNQNTSEYDNSEFIANVVPGTGCTSSLTYYWEYKNYSSSYWTYFGNTQRVIFPLSSEGSYQVRCRVTDACNVSATGEDWITLYESQNNCSGYYAFSLQSDLLLNENNLLENEELENNSPVLIPSGKPHGTVIYIQDSTKQE